MKNSWNKKIDLPKLIFEDEDLARAMRIEQMINGKHHCLKCGSTFDTKGWEDLQYYMNLQKAKMEMIMMQGIAMDTIVPESSSQVQIAKWAMFNYLINLPKNIIEGAQKYREKLKKQEDIQRGEREYDQY